MRQSSITALKYEFHPVKLQKIERKAKALDMSSFKKLQNSEIKKVVNLETSLEQVQINKMSNEDWIYLLMHSNLDFFSYEAFKTLMKNDWVQNKIA